MNQDRLEHLITRYLDRECTPGERAELMAAVRSDRGAEALFEEYSALDREFGAALRKALHRRASLRLHRASDWVRGLRIVGLGVAACVAIFLWKSPPAQRPERAGESRPMLAGSWFAPPPAAGDSLRNETAAAFNWPRETSQVTQRNWVVVPGEDAGEFLVIEVKRVQTRSTRIQEDF